MSDTTEGIERALAAWEGAARAVRAPSHWHVNERPSVTAVWASDEGPGGKGRSVVSNAPAPFAAAHIAANDPAAVLRMVEHLRRIVEASVHHARYDDGPLGDHCRGNLDLIAAMFAPAAEVAGGSA